MRVKAVKDIPITERYVIKKGSEFNLPRFPKAAEWLSAGLVVPVREEKIETAVREPQERAITR